jgi:LuxR family maltose regulon positive regulatory protein
MTRAPWILESKLAAPAWPTDGLTRALLPGGAPLPPVTLLVAGAGYGKTLAMSALAATAPADAVRIWYSLDPSDADLATFFHYMIAGVRAHLPQFGAEIEALLLGE